jgi:hypothetical protein
VSTDTTITVPGKTAGGSNFFEFADGQIKLGKRIGKNARQ